MQVSKDQIQSAKEANLADFFRRNGYECEQHGNELHVRGFGGLYVNTIDNTWYQFSSQQGNHNPVDCLVDVLGMDFTSAVSELSTVNFEKNISNYPPKTETPTAKTQEKTELSLPENEHNKNRIFAYLVKERGIDAALIQDLVNQKILYQGSVKYKGKDGSDKLAKGNAVFVQTDAEGNISGAEIHGTNTYKRFKAIAGSGGENLFKYAIGNPKKVYAFESAIDLLSFKMLANPEKIQDSLLVSMGGLKAAALKKLEESGLKIYSCVDNDERGKAFNISNGFAPANRKLVEENCKDWNELLKKRILELSQKGETLQYKNDKKIVPKSHKR